MDKISPQQLAEQCAAEMWRQDLASQKMGMKLEKVEPGSAILTMKIKGNMLNGYKVCHGGYIFSLADSCFAFSCNTYNTVTLAIGCSIDYLSPVKGGQIVTATGIERKKNKTTGVYDVTLTVEDKTVALFRGKSYSLMGNKIIETV